MNGNGNLIYLTSGLHLCCFFVAFLHLQCLIIYGIRYEYCSKFEWIYQGGPSRLVSATFDGEIVCSNPIESVMLI